MGKMAKWLSGSRWIGFLSFLILWEGLHLLLRTHTIPSPMETLAYMVTAPWVLLQHAGASLLRVLVSVGFSLVIGIPTGVLLGVNRTCGRLFSPLLYFLYPIPKVAFLPVFMLLFGLGNTSKILLVLFIIVFQMMLSVRDGVTHIPPLHYQVMESHCASVGQKYRYLILPTVFPQIFAGLRISIGISLASLFFAENYATRFGIGYHILSAWTKMDYVEMFGGILTLGFVGIFLLFALDSLEAACLPWRKR